jgi:hypothetical protein
MLPSHDRLLVDERIADLRRVAEAERLARHARQPDPDRHPPATLGRPRLAPVDHPRESARIGAR